MCKVSTIWIYTKKIGNHFTIIFQLNRCGERTVTKAYHVCCKECAKRERCCAKCLTSADRANIEPPEKTPEEQLQLKVEMERLIKSLPERKRRTFLRYMNKGKEIDSEANELQADNKNKGKLKLKRKGKNT